MSNITPIDQARAPGGPDTVLLEKIRWSYRQRFRKQVQLLLVEFFDEVDDYLFATGRSGELCGEGACLNAMRELRAKQNYFEERFLDSALSVIKKSYHDEVVDFSDAEFGGEFSDNLFSDNGMEEVEVDLALHAAQRRAVKHHFAMLQRIKALQNSGENPQAFSLIDPDVILQAIDLGFGNAHRLLSLPLELRLLFIKLFERHVMLRLERVFQDVISIIHHANDPTFVEKLYSSSSAFHRAGKNENIVDVGDEKTVFQAGTATRFKSGENERSTDDIRNSVEMLINKLCGQRSLPDFLRQMIDRQWRETMFLIGMHRGTTGLEWSEARHALELLIAASDKGFKLERQDYEQIKQQLQRGFSLIQWSRQEQVDFFSRLADQFQEQQVSATGPAAMGQNSYIRRRQLESSISPAGEQLLDQDDLDEIAKLLGGGSRKSEKQLEDYLEDVDNLADQTMVDFMLDGAYTQCLLARKPDTPQQYVISKRGARISVTRSRLGVALALQSGEIRVNNIATGPQTDSRTVLVTANKYRH